MQIAEYDDINPLAALEISLLALDFALTPEYAATLRRSDPRPFPCLALYAVEDGVVLGQVGVFRLPFISTAGREDVGGVWAVATHPEHAGRGVASLLLEEAHTRMAAAGLRFSTLATDRFRSGYRLYRRHGYEDMQVTGTALARWDVAHQPTRLVAGPPGEGGYDFVEQLFARLAADRLGFAWRHTPFARLRQRVAPGDIWVLRQGGEAVGYALAHLDRSLLRISNLLLANGICAAEAVAAVLEQVRAPYVQVAVSRPTDEAALCHTGYQVAHPDWGSFMLKPLVPDVNAEDARRLFGIGSDRFLVSWLDTT